MRYIITGATGMIAISIMNLLKENNEIYAIVRPGSSKIKNIPVDSNIHVIECDVSDLCNVSLMYYFILHGRGLLMDVMIHILSLIMLNIH